MAFEDTSLQLPGNLILKDNQGEYQYQTHNWIPSLKPMKAEAPICWLLTFSTSSNKNPSLIKNSLLPHFVPDYAMELGSLFHVLFLLRVFCCFIFCELDATQSLLEEENLIDDWCGGPCPIISGTIPGQMELGCIRKIDEQARKQVSKQCSSVCFISSSCFTSSPDFL